MIWTTRPDADTINGYATNHMGHFLGVEITEIGDDYISGRMPVDERTKQPYGILHGGASCVLAETLGSLGGAFCVDVEKQIVVGLEINANHLRPAFEGYITGTARPIHIGKTTHVWDIKITNEKGDLVCISRLTLAVKDMPKQ
ncbi:MAG: hotdog fold thioesterase [Bacteroidetes bacterium]|nr:hotdog fold thioesterase [Bacteroidota bacterium]